MHLLTLLHHSRESITYSNSNSFLVNDHSAVSNNIGMNWSLVFLVFPSFSTARTALPAGGAYVDNCL